MWSSSETSGVSVVPTLNVTMQLHNSHTAQTRGQDALCLLFWLSFKQKSSGAAAAASIDGKSPRGHDAQLLSLRPGHLPKAFQRPGLSHAEAAAFHSPTQLLHPWPHTAAALLISLQLTHIRIISTFVSATCAQHERQEKSL